MAHLGKLSHCVCENREIRRVRESVGKSHRINRRGESPHTDNIDAFRYVRRRGGNFGPEKCEWMRDAEKWEREANTKKDATLLSLNASDDEGEVSDDDDEEDWNDTAGEAAADIASFFANFSVDDTDEATTTAAVSSSSSSATKTTTTTTEARWNVRDEEIDEKMQRQESSLKSKNF